VSVDVLDASQHFSELYLNIIQRMQISRGYNLYTVVEPPLSQHI
jgi:hypothetical protein